MSSNERTVQEAAKRILVEIGHPLSLKELGRRMYKNGRGLVNSNARDPERSLASALDQAIRDKKEPLLVVMEVKNERLVGLKTWENMGSESWWEDIKIHFKPDEYKQLRAAQIVWGSNLEDTAKRLIMSGLEREMPEIIKGLQKQLESLASDVNK